jgi:hypothetical protein
MRSTSQPWRSSPRAAATRSRITDLATGNQLSVGSYLEDSPFRVSNLAGFSDDGRYVAFIDKHGHLYVRGRFPA